MNENELLRLTLMYQEIKDVREAHQDFEAAMCADLAVRMLAVMRDMNESLVDSDMAGQSTTRYWLKELERCFEEKHTGAA